MQEKILTSRLIQDERETHFYIDGQKVICDSTEPKYFNKCLRQGWTPIAKTVYTDGTVCGMILEAPAKAISIRNAKVKKRVMTEEQIEAARERMKNLHKNKEDNQ